MENVNSYKLDLSAISTGTKPSDATDIAPANDRADGGYEGAQRNSRELYNWTPTVVSPNQQIGAEKDMADARGIDMVQNDGFMQGAISTHRDSIVGAKYVLNCKPDYKTLARFGADEKWAEEFQEYVEDRFNLLADSPDNWLDASRMNTLTGLVRLGIGSFFMSGEVLATAEWIRQARRPCRTAIQMISPFRLSNPDGTADTSRLKSGVEIDRYGAPIAHWIRTTFPNDMTELNSYRWKRVPTYKPWGRRQVIHIIEQLQPSASRGIADMVSALKNMRMTKNFKEVTLQNAVIQASYAASIESELPPEVVYGQLGQGQSGLGDALNQYMGGLAEYQANAKNIAVDGAKIPHLYPNTKLKMQPLGTPGGVGTEFEQSLHRHTAAALGLSHEQFTRDFTQTNYSSARAAMAGTEKFMRSRKKLVADGTATNIFALWLEEEIAGGEVPLPPRMRPEDFYQPLVKEALTRCDWIGASRGQIDEKKETEAALMRIRGGLSTYESEIARMGEDWRRVFAQRAREEKLMATYGLSAETDPKSNKNDDPKNEEDDK